MLGVRLFIELLDLLENLIREGNHPSHSAVEIDRDYRINRKTDIVEHLSAAHFNDQDALNLICDLPDFIEWEWVKRDRAQQSKVV